jgi:hypothetical protein
MAAKEVALMAAPATNRTGEHEDDRDSPRLSNKELQVWRPTDKFNVALSLGSAPDDRVAYARSEIHAIHVGVHDRPLLPEWVGAVLAQVRDLSSLKSNWDTHGAGPISTHVWMATLSTLSSVMPFEGKSPELVPTSSGGVDIEWQGPWGYLSIQVRPHKEAVAYYSGALDEWEEPLVGRLRKVRGILSSMNT